MASDDDIQRGYDRAWRRGAFWGLGFVTLFLITEKVVDAISNFGLAMAVGFSIIVVGSFVLWKLVGIPGKEPQIPPPPV